MLVAEVTVGVEVVMLRLAWLLIVGSSSVALAQTPPPPAPPAPDERASNEAPVELEVVPEEPKMKKVCRAVEVVGSAIPRTVCTMKPVRNPKPK